MKEKIASAGKWAASRLAPHKTALTAALGILILYTGLFLVGITCPIKFLTGVSCAGCGMTRAWIRVLHLDFAGAWEYHPLFFCPPLVIPIFFLKNRRPVLYRGLLIAVVLLFVVVYFLRMFDPGCDIVVFQPKSSVFYKIAAMFSKLF